MMHTDKGTAVRMALAVPLECWCAAAPHSEWRTKDQGLSNTFLRPSQHKDYKTVHQVLSEITKFVLQSFSFFPKADSDPQKLQTTLQSH